MPVLKHVLASWLLTTVFGASPYAVSQDQITTFNLGRVVSEQEIATWDTDVKPSGEGLPAGQGNTAEGARLYAQHCIACHGANGKGGPFNALASRIKGDDFPFARDGNIPKTVGNYWPFATTVFDYIKRAMPMDKPGSLQVDEVYALTAYILWLNEIIDQEAEITQANLATIEMPARARFVPLTDQGIPELDALRQQTAN